MQSPYECVREFHHFMGHPINDELQMDIFESNPKEVTFRLGLIDEEIEEYAEAWDKDSDAFVLAVDALADTLYVTFGTCLSLGIKYDELFQHNPSRTVSPKNVDTYFAEHRDMIESHIFRLRILSRNLKHGCDERNMDDIIRDINVLVTAIYALGEELGADLVGAFDEVHRSNMTKLCPCEADAVASVEIYKTTQTRYTDPSYRLSDCGNYWVIYDAATSKILKNQVSYDEPHLLRFCA